MDENIYDEVVINKDQQNQPISEADEYAFYTNECYELQQSYRQQNNTSNERDLVIRFQNSSRESGGEGEQPGYKKGDSHILKIKTCLIALSCAVVLLTIVVIAVVTLGVVYYFNSSRELTNEVSILNSQLNQMTQESETRLTNKDNIISEQIVQLQNMTIKLEGRLTNKDSSLSNQLDQLQNTTIELERNLMSSLSNQFDQLQNITIEMERRLTNKDSSLSNQLDQLQNTTIEFEEKLINMGNFLSNQLDQVQNMTIEMEERLTNEDSSMSNQLDQLQNMTIQLEEKLTNKDSFLNNQLDQLNNETREIENELRSDINTLKLQHNQSVSLTQDNLSLVINSLNTVKDDLSLLQVQIYCGAGQWNRIAFLDMSDPSQQCPSAWRLVTTNGVRACGRQGSSCHGTSYFSTHEYDKVCGRVIGYQDGHTDGFERYGSSGTSINNAYMDGVSITRTHEGTRYHIWSYVAGVSESRNPNFRGNCPCSTRAGTGPPSFVGDNYYCESGNPNTAAAGLFFDTDKLWDGKQCEGTCCSGSKSPPWFSVHLPNSTTESIEVRICSNESTNDEDSPIELLEIYVQ